MINFSKPTLWDRYPALKTYLLIMKLSFIISFLGIMQVYASVYSQNTKLTFAYKDVSVKEVLSEIEKTTDFRFFYNEDFIDMERKVELEVTDMILEDVLSKLLASSEANYKVLENNLVIIAPKEINLQQTVSGKVTDSQSGEVLAGVNVVVKGTTTGTSTDARGNYSLNVADKNVTLVFSFIGYVTQEIPLSGRTTLDVALLDDVTDLDEVVVIGYGTRVKKDVTTSISAIDASKIQNVVTMTGEIAMQGKMSGVQVSGNTGNPMSRPTVRIRGTNTWGVSAPLYVIDGIPVVEYGAGIEGLEDPRASDIRGPVNIMSTIDPNDIESISVLKDASSAAIYGVRAANGVILITTKKGRVGEKVSIEIGARYGVQNITQKLDVLNTAQYTKFIQDVYASDPTSTVATENIGLFDPASPKYLGNSQTYDWQDAVKVKNAPTQDYSFRLSGGTDKTDYFLSFGYGSTDGTSVGNYLERKSGAFNINSQVNKFLKIGTNFRISLSDGRDRDLNYWQTALTAPWQPIYDPNGPGGWAKQVDGVLSNGSYSSNRMHGTGSRIHAPALVDFDSQTYKSIRNMGTAYLELTPFKGMKIKGSVSADSYDFTRYTFGDYSASVFNYTVGDPRSLGGGNSVGSYEERPVRNRNIISEFTANYNNKFGDHSIDLLFNLSNQQYKSMYSIGSTEYMTSTNPDLWKLSGEKKYTTAESIPWEKSALVGQMIRASYNYKSKYYADATVRRDGSSRFAPENQWGIFPSFSLAWRVTGESFMSGIGWLNDLKLRGGWGQLGNQEVTPWAYLSPITNKPNYVWGNDPSNIGRGYWSEGATVFGMANPNLQWEKLSTTTVGFDATLVKNLNISFEYYNKLNDGILQTVTLPSSLGLVEAPKANIASVRNKGIEVSFNYTKEIGDLILTFGGNLTTVKNSVETTYKGIPMGTIEEGYPIYYIKGYKYGGIFQSQSELDAWLAENSDASYQVAKLQPGDTYYLDQRSAPTEPGTFYKDSLDNKIDSYDQVYLGKTIPGFFYGFNIDAQYKGFDFSAQFTGVGDVQKINSLRQSLENPGTTGSNIYTSVLNYWTPSNTNTSIPRLIYGDPAQNMRFSSRFVESGAYLRLSTIQLGYTLPDAFYKLTKETIRNLRVYVGMSNVFTLTKYTGLDPENDNYPVPKIMYFGVNARF
jgi:TonB-linked SusC/RagA family outer membrane protein